MDYDSQEPVHDFFGLTYANYLVLHRTLMQSMPVEWQDRFVRCVEELQSAFAHVEQPETYFVSAAVERELWELSDREMPTALEGPVTFEFDEDDPEHQRGGTYFVDGEERDSNYRVHLRADDPVPHYNRGRTRIEPK